MSLPTIWIIIGTLLFAVGGLIATYGWVTRTEEVQKSLMVRSVAAELMGNIAVLKNPDIVETDEVKLSQFVVFPRMNIAVMEGAISSGQFLKEEDRLFFTRVVNLRELVAQFNLRLSLTESEMRNNPQNIALFRTKLRDGATRNQLSIKLVIFGNLLMSDYGLKESDVFFVPLEEDAILTRSSEKAAEEKSQQKR